MTRSGCSPAPARAGANRSRWRRHHRTGPGRRASIPATNSTAAAPCSAPCPPPAASWSAPVASPPAGSRASTASTPKGRVGAGCRSCRSTLAMRLRRRSSTCDRSACPMRRLPGARAAVPFSFASSQNGSQPDSAAELGSACGEGGPPVGVGRVRRHVAVEVRRLVRPPHGAALAQAALGPVDGRARAAISPRPARASFTARRALISSRTSNSRSPTDSAGSLMSQSRPRTTKYRPSGVTGGDGLSAAWPISRQEPATTNSVRVRRPVLSAGVRRSAWWRLFRPEGLISRSPRPGRAELLLGDSDSESRPRSPPAPSCRCSTRASWPSRRPARAGSTR